MTYFFVLGRNPALSIAEILALLYRENVGHKITAQSSKVLILETTMDITKLYSELGGSIKFGEMISINANTAAFIRHLPQSGKIFFGFSLYRIDDDFDEKNLISAERQLKKYAMEIKKMLRARGLRSRFVSSRKRELSSVIVKTNKLLSNGAEFVFFAASREQFHGLNHGTAHDLQKLVVGKTLAVQDFEEYEFRDYGRPRRNILRGMLPPKIAKIMINLAGTPKTGALLDPFCGEGTILAEAAVLGYKNLLGIDIDEKAVEDARVNLDWIHRNYGYNDGNNHAYDIRRGDVRELASLLPKNSVDAIVTEPCLGPLVRGQAEEKEVLKTKEELERLYAVAFKNFSKILKPDGRVVFIFPVWRTKQKNIFIDLGRILSSGFVVQNLCDASLRWANGGEQYGNLSADCSHRGGIIWQRPDQKVLREIIVLRFKE